MVKLNRLRGTYFIWRDRLVKHLCNYHGKVYIKEVGNNELHIVKATSLKKPTKEELALYLIAQ